MALRPFCTSCSSRPRISINRSKRRPPSCRSSIEPQRPLPALKPGRYDLSLTRITFPAQMPSNPPHHRSGAALYYIVSGTGANTVEGKVEAKGTRFVDLRTVRACAPVGKPGRCAADIPGIQHQLGRRGCRCFLVRPRKSVIPAARDVQRGLFERTTGRYSAAAVSCQTTPRCS